MALSTGGGLWSQIEGLSAGGGLSTGNGLAGGGGSNGYNFLLESGSGYLTLENGTTLFEQETGP